MGKTLPSISEKMSKRGLEVVNIATVWKLAQLSYRLAVNCATVGMSLHLFGLQFCYP